MNKYLKEKKYEVKLEKRTAEEKLNDFEKFKDKYRPSQKREFTRANKLKKENKTAENKLNNTNDELKNKSEELTDINNQVDVKNKESAELDQKIEEQKEEYGFWKNKINEIKEAVQKTVNSGIQFAMDNLPVSLFNYKKNQKNLDQVHKRLGNETHKFVIDEQPTEKQKRDVKNSRRP